MVNKTIQRVVVSSSQNQQLASAFRQQNANANTVQATANTLLNTGK